jgi:hypothetical protein
LVRPREYFTSLTASQQKRLVSDPDLQSNENIKSCSAKRQSDRLFTAAKAAAARAIGAKDQVVEAGGAQFRFFNS